MKSITLLKLLTLGIAFSGALLAQTQDRRGGAGASDARNSQTQSAGKSSNDGPSAASMIASDPDYRLAIGDEIAVDVHGESEFSVAQRIDKKGMLKMYAIDEVSLANKTVREAEAFIEKTLIDKKQLRKPLVNIVVREYSSRQVSVYGFVGNPGIHTLPREADSIEIVELIARVGFFKPTAKSSEVRVTRTDTNGKETTVEVNVEAMINNGKNAPKSFLIYPGDKILVTERVF